MPKIKMKSSVKKRFRANAAGKILMPQAGRRHGMCKRSNKFLRDSRGTAVMHSSDVGRFRRLIPYGL